jgi:hypothetical protein
LPIASATHHPKKLESCALIEISRRGKFVDAVFQRGVWNADLAEPKRV